MSLLGIERRGVQGRLERRKVLRGQPCVGGSSLTTASAEGSACLAGCRPVRRLFRWLSNSPQTTATHSFTAPTTPCLYVAPPVGNQELKALDNLPSLCPLAVELVAWTQLLRRAVLADAVLWPRLPLSPQRLLERKSRSLGVAVVRDSLNKLPKKVQTPLNSSGLVQSLSLAAAQFRCWSESAPGA